MGEQLTILEILLEFVMTKAAKAFFCLVILLAVSILGRAQTTASVEERRIVSEKIAGQLDSFAVRESLASSPDD